MEAVAFYENLRRRRANGQTDLSGADDAIPEELASDAATGAGYHRLGPGGDAGGAWGKPPLRVVTVAELLGMELPPRQYALAPVLPLPGLAMLYAPRGMGKTYLALSLALAIGSGAPVLKWAAPAPRRVLYVDGEMPVVALQERVARLIRAAPTLLQEDCLRFLCADLQPDGLLSIARPPGQAKIEEAMDDADVLILDNLSTLADGLRENEADDWGPLQRWLLALRRAGKTVLLIHHAGKGGQQRGTSRREDALDTVIALRRPADYEPEQGARFEVCLEKARGVVGPDAAPFEAKLVEDAEGGLAWAWADLADAKEDRAADLLRNGLSIRDVADATGLSKSAVGRLKQRLDQERGHGRT